MEIISVIGMVLGVAVLIYLTFKGVNGFVASLVGSVIVIVSSGLPFWGTLTGTYAASLGSTFGSYLFLFTIGSAYSELMKKSGAAESIANFLFAFLGVKATVAGTLIITFLLAYGGVNAFIIIFAVYPVAVPMFRKANVSKLLMPAIFLYGAVVLNVVTPGAPSMLCIALSEKLGVTTFAAPTMAIVLLVVAFGFGIFYFTWASNSLRARGIGFVASESDAELIAGSTSGKELPPIHLAILPYIVIIVLKLVLANSMSASDGINTAMGVGAIVLIITNYKYLKGHIVQDLVTGFTSSINPLLLTAALMGFASVVNACAGFQYFMNFAMMLADKMNPYISAVIVTNVFSGITGRLPQRHPDLLQHHGRPVHVPGHRQSPGALQGRRHGRDGHGHAAPLSHLRYGGPGLRRDHQGVLPSRTGHDRDHPHRPGADRCNNGNHRADLITQSPHKTDRSERVSTAQSDADPFRFCLQENSHSMLQKGNETIWQRY